MTTPNITRTGERLIRLAYELEGIAARLAAAGLVNSANSVRAASRECGNAGRAVDKQVRPRVAA